ncbi:hypothetical protein J8Z81_20115 [Yersinia enterocolitica]|nr:hypothetical protein [Yersinia enterocolitica]MBX9489717.1 hypothetical protein [Yersinia enterocolitica]
MAFGFLTIALITQKQPVTLIKNINPWEADMEIFWIVAGVVVIIIYLINQNKTKTNDRTVIRQVDTIKTQTGEVRIERTKVVDSTNTKFTAAPTVQENPSEAYNHAVIQSYTQERIEPRVEKTVEFSQSPEPAVIQRAEQKSPPLLIENEDRKKCPRCSRTMFYSKFRKSPKQPDGLTIWCGECLDAPRDTDHKKYCPKCKKRRMKYNFYPNSNRKDKLTLWCKDCMDKSNKA